MKRNHAFALIVVAGFAVPPSIFTQGGTAESPRQLQSLMENYERAKARAMDPLDWKLDAALLELQRQFTKEGRLKDAVAVNAVIESRSEDSDASEPSWKNTRWKWGSGGELELKRNGEATHTSWSQTGEWELLDDGTVKLISQHGESIIVFTDGKSGDLKSLNGGRTTLTLIE